MEGVERNAPAIAGPPNLPPPLLGAQTEEDHIRLVDAAAVPLPGSPRLSPVPAPPDHAMQTQEDDLRLIEAAETVLPADADDDDLDTII